MFKFRLYFLLLLALAVTSLNSCSEDDEDPIPLPTLDGKWVLDYIELRNLQSPFGAYAGEYNAALLGQGVISLKYEFIQDENEQSFTEFVDVLNGVTVTTTGTWEFNDDETSLSLFFDGGNDVDYEVVEFTLNKLVLRVSEVFSLPDPNSPDPENPNFVNVNATVIYNYYKVY